MMIGVYGRITPYAALALALSARADAILHGTDDPTPRGVVKTQTCKETPKSRQVLRQEKRLARKGRLK